MKIELERYWVVTNHRSDYENQVYLTTKHKWVIDYNQAWRFEDKDIASRVAHSKGKIIAEIKATLII